MVKKTSFFRDVTLVFISADSPIKYMKNPPVKWKNRSVEKSRVVDFQMLSKCHVKSEKHKCYFDLAFHRMLIKAAPMFLGFAHDNFASYSLYSKQIYHDQHCGMQLTKLLCTCSKWLKPKPQYGQYDMPNLKWFTLGYIDHLMVSIVNLWNDFSPALYIGCSLANTGR